MKVFFLSILFFLTLSLVHAQAYEDLLENERAEDFPEIENIPFDYGEEINYKIYFGFFTVGRGSFKIYKNPYNINNRGAYKVDVRAKTTGVLSWLATVDDHWGGYLDTTSLIPHVAYRNIKEGKYRKNEVVSYDHNSQMLKVKWKGRKDSTWRDPMYYQFPPQIRDLISGFAYVRALDFDTINVGDIITIPAFFEDTFYNLEIRYRGIEVVETNIGDIFAHKLAPIMPENSIFDGEDSVVGWFSADKNKIPIKINAELFIGDGGLEITSFRKVKYPINFYMEE